MENRRIEVDIEELVLEGYPGHDPDHLAATLETKLGTRASGPGLWAARDRGEGDVTVDVPYDAAPDRWAEAVARVVDERLRPE